MLRVWAGRPVRLDLAPPAPELKNRSLYAVGCGSVEQFAEVFEETGGTTLGRAELMGMRE